MADFDSAFPHSHRGDRGEHLVGERIAKKCAEFSATKTKLETLKSNLTLTKTTGEATVQLTRGPCVLGLRVFDTFLHQLFLSLIHS